MHCNFFFKLITKSLNYQSFCFSHTKSRVVVTGMGIVCPLGVGVENVWNHLIASKCGITKVKGKSYQEIPCQVAGYVPQEQLDLKSKFTKTDLKNLSMSTIYALIAAEEALTQANWKPKNESDQQQTGVAIGTGMVDLVEVVESGCLINDNSYKSLSPHFITKILINMPSGHVSIKYGLTGPNHCASTACTTGVHSIGDAFNFIQRGYAKTMICGGTEAVISPLAIGSFSKIRALCTKYNHQPDKASRPFDGKRCGFVMGEGCGLIVVEELNHALQRNANIYGEILGYGLSGEANHITAPREDGKGAYQCMKCAIEDANINPEQITHVNAHATSTLLGDLAEIKAIKNLFGDKHVKNIAITSTKGATGHLIGAAGSVEAIFTILACYKSIIPPSINIDDPLDKQVNIVANVSQKWKVNNNKRIAITNSFGFGGTNASLVISNYVF